MRRIRKISAEEENFRTEALTLWRAPSINVIRRDPVQPEPIGTTLLIPMRVIGYDRDCDGSLMARLEAVPLDELDGRPDSDMLAADIESVHHFGVAVITHMGLYPNSGIVATPDEIRALLRANTPEGGSDDA
jgi:hypothetical protein